MTTPRGPGNAPYVPIDCGFHDVLLDLATRRRSCEIHFLDADGAARTVRGRIEDVYSRDGAEYLRLDSGKVIRLDRLLRAGDTPAPGAGEPGR